MSPWRRLPSPLHSGFLVNLLQWGTMHRTRLAPAKRSPCIKVARTAEIHTVQLFERLVGSHGFANRAAPLRRGSRGLSLSAWMIIISVATRTTLGLSSSLSYLLCSSANGRVTVHSLLLLTAKPLNLSLSNFNLDHSNSLISAKQLVLGFSSHRASALEAKKSGSKGGSLCVFFVCTPFGPPDKAWH